MAVIVKGEFMKLKRYFIVWIGVSLMLLNVLLTLFTSLGLLLYLTMLPIIVLTSRKKSSFLAGVIIAFVYGFVGMFVVVKRFCNTCG